MASDQHRRDKKRRKAANKEKLSHAYKAKAKAIHSRVSRYPEIVFDEAAGTPEFVSLIKDVQKDIDLDDPAVCTDTMRQCYRCIQDHGFDAYRGSLQAALPAGDNQAMAADSFNHAFMMNYGSVLYRRIPEEVRRRYLPFNDAYVHFHGNQQFVFFSSLLSTPSDGGTIYHSRLAPTVTLGGTEWKVGFSRHAIEQAVLRLNPNYLEYAAAGDVHAFFAKCIYHEPSEINSAAHPQQPAFCMYDTCGGPTFTAYDVYAKQILGVGEPDSDIVHGGIFFRLGYFPVVFDKGFAKATTFMRPGYTGTPELRLLQHTEGMPREQKAFLLREARENTGREALLVGRFEIIKWFHDNGVLQVKRFRKPLFNDRLKINEARLTTVSHQGLVKEAMKEVSRKDLKARLRKKGR